MGWHGLLVAFVTGLCCAADCSVDPSTVHVQLTVMLDVAAFDNGNSMSSSMAVRTGLASYFNSCGQGHCGYGQMQPSIIFYGDISNPPKQQCSRVILPLPGSTPYLGYIQFFRSLSAKGDTHWARPTSLEGSFLSALRYAMRADGWLQGEVDESGRRIVQIILAVGDVAGTVGTDESDLGDPMNCDNLDYPTMHAVSEDQKNFLPNGIFLFLGDRDYPTIVRDAVDAFNTETLPYFLNGARGSAYRLSFPTTKTDISNEFKKLISDAVCGNVPFNPPSGPPPPPRDRLPMTTTTSTTPPSRTLCPNMQSFADIHLQVVFALDMAAFDGKSPARNVGFIRGDILTAMEYIKEGFPTSDISLYLYSDKGVANGKCADRRFDLIPSADAVAQTANMFTGAGWNTLWERQYESEGSLFSVYRYIVRQQSWIRSDVDESGKKVVRVVMAYSDEAGKVGMDETDLIDDPNTCGDYDYPSQFALNRDAGQLGAYFFFIGARDQPHPIRDTVNYFNTGVLHRQLSGCIGRAEEMSPDGSHISQTWHMIKEAACGIAVSPVG